MNGIIDTINNWFSDTTQNASASWDNAVAALKTRAREFISVFVWLESKQHVAERDPRLAAEYHAVMNKGRVVKNTVEKTTGGFDWITGKLKALGGGMGVLPAVPLALSVATIMGLVAALGYWLTDAYKLKTKLEYAENHGIDPTMVFNAVNGSAVNSALLLAGGAFVAWYFLSGEQ